MSSVTISCYTARPIAPRICTIARSKHEKFVHRSLGMLAKSRLMYMMISMSEVTTLRLFLKREFRMMISSSVRSQLMEPNFCETNHLTVGYTSSSFTISQPICGRGNMGASCTAAFLDDVDMGRVTIILLCSSPPISQ